MTDTAFPLERLLTRQQVESHFGFPTKRYLEIAAMRGDGPPMVRIGRSVRYRYGDVLAWIEANRVTSTADRA